VSALAIAWASVRRVVRDRTALFFIVVLPIAVILIIGVSVRGFQTFKVGVLDEGAGSTGRAVITALAHDDGLAVVRYGSPAAVSKAVARGEVTTAVILPAGMDEAVRAGRSATVGIIAEQTNTSQQAAAQAVEAVVARQGALVQAAQFTVSAVGGTYDAGLAVARAEAGRVAQASVTSRVVDANANVLPEGFSYSAPTMLVLFIFLSGVVRGANIVDNRRLGMYERMGAAPVRAVSVIAGEGVGFAVVALGQALLIVVVALVVFGVSWGDPLAATALVLVWIAVGAGAGMLAGTLFRTPEQAAAVGPVVGIAFAMLGGCMWPLAIVSSTMRQVGHATPHAWAVDAWTALLARHGTIATIGGDLLVLCAFAAGLLLIGTVRFRRVLTVR